MMKNGANISNELTRAIGSSLPHVERSVLKTEYRTQSDQVHGFDGDAMIDAVGSWRSSRIFRWGIIYGLWSSLGFLYTSQLYLGMKYEGMNHSYPRLLFWQLAGCWLPWAVVTLPIV